MLHNPIKWLVMLGYAGYVLVFGIADNICQFWAVLDIALLFWAMLEKAKQCWQYWRMHGNAAQEK